MYKLGVPNTNLNPVEEKITSQLKMTKGSKDKKTLKDTCQKFEAIFLEKIWDEMKKSVSSEGLFKDPLNNKYVDLFDYDFCLKMARDGGIGLAGYLYNNLVEQLEQKSHETILDKKDINNTNQLKNTQQTISSEPPNITYENEDLSDKINEIAEKIEKRAEAENNFLPVDGKISSTFGWRQDPFLKEIRWHNGVDIAAPKGSPIKSVTQGEVIFSGEKHGYGNVVIIQGKNGIKTIYAHNEKNLVKQGDKVKKGDVIALVGNTGRATGPHLHFELRINDKPVDPINFLYPKYAKKIYKEHEGA